MMIQSIPLLLLLSLTAAAAPDANLEKRRNLAVQGRPDRGFSISLCQLSNIDNPRPTFQFSIIDGIPLYLSPFDVGYRGFCTGQLVSNLRGQDGNYSVDLPTGVQYCEAELSYLIYPSTSNNGLMVNINHTVSFDGGPPLLRTATINLPAVSQWRLMSRNFTDGSSTGTKLLRTINAPIDPNAYTAAQIVNAPAGTTADKYSYIPDTNGPKNATTQAKNATQITNEGLGTGTDERNPGASN